MSFLFIYFVKNLNHFLFLTAKSFYHCIVLDCDKNALYLLMWCTTSSCSFIKKNEKLLWNSFSKVHLCQRCNYRFTWLYETPQSFRKMIRAAYFWFVINSIPIKQAELFQNLLSKIHKKKDFIFFFLNLNMVLESYLKIYISCIISLYWWNNLKLLVRNNAFSTD